MGFFGEIEKELEKKGMGDIEKEAEQMLNQQGGANRIAGEAEKAAGGKNSKYGKMIEEGEGLYGQFGGGQNQGQGQGHHQGQGHNQGR